MLTKDVLEFGRDVLTLGRVACPDPAALPPTLEESTPAGPAVPAKGNLRRALLIAVPISSLIWAGIIALALKLYAAR